LLLTDILMPPMNGVKLADELRAMRPALRVLLMSAYTTEQAEDYGVRLIPGIPLLVKPFKLTELHSKVRAVLDYRSPFSRRRGPSQTYKRAPEP
jgi:DNA-binding response OmpR family regulator